PTDSSHINSFFGATNGRSAPHNGVDIRNPMNGPAYATDIGTVIHIFYNDRGGNQILIQLQDGSVVGYAHTKPISDLSIGDMVMEGQVIGHSDASGSHNGVRVPPHTHFTYRPCITCANEDPLDYLQNSEQTPDNVPQPAGRKGG